MSDALSVVESQFSAYNKHDLDAFVASFSDNFIAYRMPSTEPSIIGKQQLREFYANHRFNQPALRAELISRTVLGNKVFDFERIHGLSEQPIESVAVFEVNNGLINTAWFYFS
ncbi:nuclear transport factor 2 family protein [Rouxiella sp. Mn2063]|uniref:nuclear transport factor 2 family protein n=1 Tax=Rouxiella sp. Mn2063 TaxID=3395262 RepID=UPI003BE4D5DF